MRFEEAMQKLENITRDLEGGNLSLEESLKKFEEGMELVGFCEQKLEEIEKRIRFLTTKEDKLKLEAQEPVNKKREKKGSSQREVENGLLFKQKNHK